MGHFQLDENVNSFRLTQPQTPFKTYKPEDLALRLRKQRDFNQDPGNINQMASILATGLRVKGCLPNVRFPTQAVSDRSPCACECTVTQHSERGSCHCRSAFC